MKYLLLVYGNEKQLSGMSTNERNTFTDACLTNEGVLCTSGHLLAVAEAPSNTATTVRIQNGKLFLTAGAFVATNEQLSKLFFIQARDLNEAIRLAAKMPYAHWGTIEVRPLLDKATAISQVTK